MTAWRGGPCPKCGEDMPEKLVHCQKCHELLNKDLKETNYDPPEFWELPELSPEELKDLD